MQFRDLGAQYQKLKSEIDANIADVISSCKFISGPQVKQLETELAAYVGVKHCVTCANGTDALELVLMAWGIGEGDAVFVPTFTFMSTAEVVSCVGARPVFTDIDTRTFNMDPASLEKAIEATLAEGKYVPKAIIPVDLFGQPADFDRIRAIAQKYGLKILEDGAQGFGGEIRGKRACSFGDAATTSFFPAKPLGCYGDGGAIFTNDDECDRLLRSLCVHGKGREKYENIRIGRNSRLDTVQAAILLPKLHAFQDYEVAAVNSVAKKYTELLADSFVTPLVLPDFLSSWAQYTILLPQGTDRAAVQAKLKERGIPVMVYYPRPLHLQKAFADCGYKPGDLPVAEATCERCLALPMHPYMTEKEINEVVTALKEVVNG